MNRVSGTIFRLMKRGNKIAQKNTRSTLTFFLVASVVVFSMLHVFHRNAGMDLATRTNHIASLLLPKPSEGVSSSSTILSAYGVVHALSLLVPGAGSKTASYAALLDALFGVQDEASAQTAIKELSTSLNSILQEANAAFVAKSLIIQDAYRDALETDYNAEVNSLNSADQVNGWVSEKTHGKITSIIDDSVAAQAALVLINAIYFKERWEYEFDLNNTNEMPFGLLNGSSTPVQMMYMKFEKTGTTFMSGWEFEADGVECIAVRLRYRGGKVSAVFGMPKDESGDMASYEAKLMSCQNALLHRRPRWRPVDKRAGGYHSGKIFLPRFEIEVEHSLTTIVQEKLGLASIFRPGDFSRIGDSSLAVSELKQKVFVKVDEHGTEAAAVTAVIALRMMPIGPIDELFIKLDRPFYFGIVEDDTNLHLFSGVVFSP